jgi:biopolymer transport protein ExbB/TolQ
MAKCRAVLAIDCAGRAADRAAALVRRRLDRGITTLKAIACIAPLLGSFGTTMALIDALVQQSLPGCNYGDCAGGLAETFVLVALSLPVAILACVGFHCLKHQLVTIDFETHTATLDLLNTLALEQASRQLEGAIRHVDLNPESPSTAN